MDLLQEDKLSFVLSLCQTKTKFISGFVSGMFGERLPLRYYLSFGMVSSGLFTALFGLGYYWNIHSLGYYAFVQVNTQQHKLLHLLPVSLQTTEAAC